MNLWNVYLWATLRVDWTLPMWLEPFSLAQHLYEPSWANNLTAATPGQTVQALQEYPKIPCAHGTMVSHVCSGWQTGNTSMYVTPPAPKTLKYSSTPLMNRNHPLNICTSTSMVFYRNCKPSAWSSILFYSSSMLILYHWWVGKGSLLVIPSYLKKLLGVSSFQMPNNSKRWNKETKSKTTSHIIQTGAQRSFVAPI